MRDFLILCLQYVRSCSNSILEMELPNNIRGLLTRKN
jgi:hypothetical protein